MIDSNLLKDISEYARLHAETSKGIYHSRGQRTDKIYNDILNGKIAEFCLYFDLISQGYELEKPDLNIYIGKRKSFDADLLVTGRWGNTFKNPKHLHVKSMLKRSIELYGLSVVFQKRDPLVCKPEDNHYIVAMQQIDHLTYKPLKWLSSKEAVFEPTHNNLPTKCAIYFR